MSGNYFCHVCGGLVDLIKLQPSGVRFCECEKRFTQLRAENERLKAELKSIDGALDDPRANLTLTTAEIIWEIKAELAEAKKDSERMVNALICMTGWTKEYALEKGWNRENASLIWSGIDSANAALDAAMKGK